MKLWTRSQIIKISDSDEINRKKQASLIFTDSGIFPTGIFSTEHDKKFSWRKTWWKNTVIFRENSCLW
jgi:hypothetical protein